MDKLSFLISVRNENEASIVESILNSEGIPTTLQHKGSGSYLNIYMGMSNFGIDILVPEDLIEQAQNILDRNQLEFPAEEIEDTADSTAKSYAENYKEQYDNRRRNRILIIAIIITLPTVISILYNLISNLIK